MKYTASTAQLVHTSWTRFSCSITLLL